MLPLILSRFALGSLNMKTEQVRATITDGVKEILEAEAEARGLDLSLYIRVILGEKAKELTEEKSA